MTSVESLNTAAAAAGFAFVLSDDVALEGTITDPSTPKWRASERRVLVVAPAPTRADHSLSNLMSDWLGALRSRVPA